MQIRHRLTGAVLVEVSADTAAGADLAHSVLLYGDLKGIDLRGANLVGADLCEADLTGAQFDDAMLTGADLSGSNLVGASFRRCSLADAKLLGVDLGGATLADADLTRTAFRLARASTPASFRNAKLARTNLSHCSFPACDFAGADLTEAMCHGTVLDDVDLRGAALTAGHFLDVSLLRANLESADLTLTAMHRVKLAGARFANSLLGSTVFAKVLDLPEAVDLSLCRHAAPSCLDLATLASGNAQLPDAFRDGAGLGDLLLVLQQLASLLAGGAA